MHNNSYFGGGVSLTIQERRTGTNLFSETSERRSEV
jgi:hypothetical protein